MDLLERVIAGETLVGVEVDHLMKTRRFDDFVFEDQRNRVEKSDEKERAADDSRPSVVTEAFAVNRITNQNPSVHRNS